MKRVQGKWEAKSGIGNRRFSLVPAAMGAWPVRTGVREAANRSWVRGCSGGCVRALFSRVICSFLLREQREVGFEIRSFLADTEFFSNVVPMKIDAVFRDAKKIGDFFARVPVPDKPAIRFGVEGRKNAQPYFVICYLRPTEIMSPR